MNRSDKITALAAAAILGMGFLTAGVASADNGVQKVNKKVTHALDKAGHAVEYSTRKDAEQTSVATHKALGKNSVVRNRGKKKNYVVHPGGTKSPEPRSSTAKK